ncbi:MAG: single-stranded DNA-binding protein [Thermodesulfobacteria bacterium]|nr:single-stranded DNA-binding protein [Thermodesulfobacteriota bacterium]
MARGLNKVMLIGRLGSDPEIRYTQDGTPVANFSLATDSPVKRGDQWESETEWHRVVAWRRLAEICSEYLGKGRLVYVEGRLRTRSWEDRDGNKRWTTEIIARDIQILDSRGGAEGGGTTELEPPAPPIEDDVPF